MKPSGEAYWRANLRLCAGLGMLWLAATFGVAWFAADLSRVEFLGWPFGFYMAAQGSLIVFVVIVWLYARIMARRDRERVAPRGSEGGAP